MKINQTEREDWIISDHPEKKEIVYVDTSNGIEKKQLLVPRDDAAENGSDELIAVDYPEDADAKNARRPQMTTDERIRRTVAAALFAALAYLCVFVFRFQVAGFLTFDFKDAVMTLGALWLGPVAGVVTAAVVALFEMISVGTTGIYGFLMNFVSSACFILPAAVLFRLRRSRGSAYVGLIVSAVVMVAVMLPLNLLIVPLYSGASREDVAGMIPTLLLPFNAVKAATNAALTALLFQPVRRALSGVKILPPEKESKKVLVWVVSIIAVLVAVAACLFFFFKLNGKFSVIR